jgi:hypothetical protein
MYLWRKIQIAFYSLLHPMKNVILQFKIYPKKKQVIILNLARGHAAVS